MNVKRVLDSLNLHQIRTQLTDHYHADGPGRTPINPLVMLKAQLAKHLLNIISDRRLALRLKHDHKIAARARLDDVVDEVRVRGLGTSLFRLFKKGNVMVTEDELNKDAFLSEILVGACPRCGSGNTHDCARGHV